jgi:hypothetical protein
LGRRARNASFEGGIPEREFGNEAKIVDFAPSDAYGDGASAIALAE